ncbi:Uncharacterised protein [uncultured archaeon]|nr:Uncharacterised protein [uncultured archaeon]
MEVGLLASSFAIMQVIIYGTKFMNLASILQANRGFLKDRLSNLMVALKATPQFFDRISFFLKPYSS